MFIDNDFLILLLTKKLDNEMKNIVKNSKKDLTSSNNSDIIDLSNEREVVTFENN